MQRSTLYFFASFLAVCGASNAALLIDDFSVNQTLLSVISGTVSSSVSSSSILGGTRNISLTVTTENSPNPATAVVANGTLDFSNSVGVSSTLTIIYDGGTDSVLTQNGFAPVNFAAGGNTFFRVSTLGDFALNSTIVLYSGVGNSQTYNFVLPSSPTLVNIDLPFATPSSSTGVFNITGVTAASVMINGITSADRSLDFLSSNGSNQVPEPMTFAMVAFGIIGLVTSARKHRASN